MSMALTPALHMRMGTAQGIATTRAGCIISSDTRVVRDPLYNGNPSAERCATVLRIAPSFLRFGSFEICKTADKQTGVLISFHPCARDFCVFPSVLPVGLEGISCRLMKNVGMLVCSANLLVKAFFLTEAGA
jgi:hypothetical protein